LITEFKNEILGSREVILIGCGSASIAAEMGAKLIASKLNKKGECVLCLGNKGCNKKF